VPSALHPAPIPAHKNQHDTGKVGGSSRRAKLRTIGVFDNSRPPGGHDFKSTALPVEATRTSLPQADYSQVEIEIVIGDDAGSRELNLVERSGRWSLA
jgi:hypothetical protein